MNAAFRVSVGLLVVAGVGLIGGVVYFMYLVDQADARPPGHEHPEVWVMLGASVAVGILATASAMFTDLRRRRVK